MAQQAFVYDDFQSFGRDDTTATQPRMYVRSNVYLPYGEVDPRTGMPVEGRGPRGRMQAKRMEYDQLEEAIRKHDAEAAKAFTISFRSAVLLVALIAFVLGMMLVSTQGTLTEKQKTLNRSQQQVTAYQEANEKLRLSIAEASREEVICYAAAQDLNMVPASAAQAIELPAANTRPISAELPVYDLTALQGAGVSASSHMTNGLTD